MRREIFEKVLLSLYPKTKFSVKEYEVHERFDMVKDGEFIKCEPSIFVTIETNKEIEPEDLSSDGTNNITDEVCKFTGKEFNIYKI